MKPEALHGRINDLDSHEMIPTYLWPEIFGDAGVQLQSIEEQRSARGGANSYVTELRADRAEITEESVWNVKGVPAPGAFDLSRRTEVLDVMGIDRQLLFPGFGFLGLLLSSAGQDVAVDMYDLDPAKYDIPKLARTVVDAHNDWVLHRAQLDERLIGVALLAPEPTPKDFLSSARRLIEEGAQALWLPAATPPGGVSPADPALDDFWTMCVENDVVPLLHVGTEFSFPRTRVWSRVPAFARAENHSLEFGLEPLAASTLHFAVENFLAALTLGGVFERHPTLPFGVIECGAQWLGPFAERLDQWADQFQFRLQQSISTRPSDYLRRNVRVTPFHFETVDRFLDRHPSLIDCYCYSSDYPHVEGGRDSAKRFFEIVEPFGDDTLEKFFVTNAQLIFSTSHSAGR
ncbi:MAG: amidohydrolase family protein [Ilumatobacteraceae bacterium]